MSETHLPGPETAQFGLVAQVHGSVQRAATASGVCMGVYVRSLSADERPESAVSLPGCDFARCIDN